MAKEQKKVIAALNRIVEHELAGMVRYTQYSLMIFGHARIPIISWMQAQATESMNHARLVGEEVTTLGGRVSLEIGELVGVHHDSVDEIVAELVQIEDAGIVLYRELLALVEGKNVSLEELARQQIRAEEMHVAEIKKMLRKRGDA